MARTLMKVDALFEGVLALVLIVGAASGRLDADDFPAPVEDTLLVGLGVVLIPVAVVLWRLGTGSVPLRALYLVAAGNGATAILVFVSLVAVSGFSTAAGVIASAVITALAFLAVAELAAAAQCESLPVQPRRSRSQTSATVSRARRRRS